MDKPYKQRVIKVYREQTPVGSFKTVDAEVLNTDGSVVKCSDPYPPQKFELGKYAC